METITACGSGCKVRGEHRTDCDREDCRGCQPRPAEHGILCERCWTQLATNLAGVPILVHHLREIARLDAVASSKPLTDWTTSSADPAHGTVLPAATLAADELWSLVESWAHVMLEEHPMTLRGWCARPWHGDAVAWMVPHLEWIARQPWAPDLRYELARDISTARARWPLPEDVERERDIPDVRCPRDRCGALALRYYPPSTFRQPFAVACGECGRHFTEDEWERFVAAHQRAETRELMVTLAEAEAARREEQVA